MARTEKTTIIVLFMLFIWLGCDKSGFAASDYSYSQEVWAKPGYGEQNGIKLLHGELVIKTEAEGKKCIATDMESENNFINFAVDDSFIFDGNFSEVILIVEYLDTGDDTFAIQYDSSYRWPYDGAFMRAGRIIRKENTGTWKTYVIRLRNVKFANRQGYGPAANAFLKEGGGDIRINNRGDGDEYISYIVVKIPYMSTEANEFGNIFEDKDTLSIALNINNRENKVLPGFLKYEIIDFDGNVIQSKNENVEIPKNTTLPHKLIVRAGRKGIFYVNFSLYEDNEKLEAHKSSFAICNKVLIKPSFDSRFGVTEFLLRGEAARITKIMNRLGISWVRNVFRPEYIGMHKSELDWEDCDNLIEEYYKNSINICGALLGDSAINPATGTEESIEDFSKFAFHIADRYKDKIKYWEIWNEPDLWGFWPGGGNAVDYTKLLKACYTAVKKVNPASKILIGGLAGGLRNKFWFLDNIYENEGGNYFDIVAIHPYTAPDAPDENNTMEEKINDIKSRLYKRGEPDKTIWITEIGWPTGMGAEKRDVGLKDQVKFLVRAYVVALSNSKIDKVFWYSFKDSGPDLLSSEQNFGLLNNDFTPKPAAVAYMNMVNQIGALSFIGRLDLEEPLRGYIFGNKYKKVYVLWSTRGTGTLNLPIRNESALLSDIMGNTEQVQIKKGKANLLLTESPVFLEEKNNTF